MNIQTLKSSLDIIEIAHQLGIQTDKNDKALCPFHEDKNPSLQFSRSKQIATCFSSKCKAGTMDVVNLVQKKTGWSLNETLKWLQAQSGLIQTDYPRITEAPELQASITEATRIEILSDLYQLFERAFIGSSKARSYAESRNLNHRILSVGYNAGTFHHSTNLFTNRAERLKQYEALGLLKKTNAGYGVFGKGCLVFALKDQRDQITGFYYRSIEQKKNSNKNSSKTGQHYYLKNRQGLYPGYPAPQTKTLILCESIIDTVTLMQSLEKDEGRSVLANYGTEGSKEQMDAIIDLAHLEELILFFDGDEAGRNGALKIAEKIAIKIAETIQAGGADLMIKIVDTPNGEDISSLLEGHEKQILIDLIETAKPYNKQAQQTTEPVFFLSSAQATAESVANEKRANEKKKIDDAPTLPALPTLETSNPNHIVYRTDAAQYVIKGGLRMDLDSMKVSLVIEKNQQLEASYYYNRKSRSKLDLYEDRQLIKICREAGEKLDLSPNRLETDLSRMTDLLDQYRQSQIQSKQHKKTIDQSLSSADRAEYIKFGRQPDLLKRINTLIGKAGIVGEKNNRLFLFCVAVSHKMHRPLHAVVQGGSGSGKSYLIAKVSELVPQQKVKRYTRLSEKSFYNFGEYELCQHLIIIEDYDGMNEEVEYAFRELQSSGTLRSAVSGKDMESATIQTRDKIVRGPIASMVATTKAEIYHDNATRVFFIGIDESLQQTAKIIDYKNAKASGAIQTDTETKAKHYLQGYVQTLKAYKVNNPYLKEIKLPVPADQLRRLHELLAAFCNQITLLHQHQRTKIDSHTIKAEKADMQLAIELLFDSIVLKVDELDGRLRGFYEALKDYLLPKGKDYAFSRREIRQAMQLSNSSLHRFMQQLLELEYIYQSGGHSNRGLLYKLSYWDSLSQLRAGIKTTLNEQLERLN